MLKTAPCALRRENRTFVPFSEYHQEMNSVFFISGLPRSGSTLLAALLRQNPACYANISSPVLAMVANIQKTLSRAQELSFNVEDSDRLRVIKGIFHSYYATQSDKIVFDTNRLWTSKIDLLLHIFPDAKLICCVRPIIEILESFERIYRENALSASAIFGFDTEINIYGRVDRLMVPNGVVGQALNALKEGYFGPHSNRLILVDYDRLTGEPDDAMNALYDALGVKRFAHDYKNVFFEAQGLDYAFGMQGLHTVRSRVERITSQATLPPDLVQLFSAPAFWTRIGHNERIGRI